MKSSEEIKSDVRKYLGDIFKEQFDDILVEIVGTSEKGDGYMGDIIFAKVNGTKGNSKEEINVVLKCSKESDELRRKFPVEQVFRNEIVLYETIFPAFRQFEIERGITDSFQSAIAKYYGKFTSDNMEVLVFENLKTIGYDLWNRKLPMPRNYLRKVLQEYAKFHAISVAMQDQKPELFKQLAGCIQPVVKIMMETTDLEQFFNKNIDEICDLLQDDLDESAIKSWRSLKKSAKRIIIGDVADFPGKKVITHGDCWCNNFLFRLSSNIENGPGVAVLDWQMASFSSPILDISYLLFSSIAKQDLPSVNTLLNEYHKKFSNRLHELGSNSNLYPFETMLKDWKKHSRFGLMMTNGIIKACLSEKDELPDVLDSVRNNVEISEAFTSDIKDKEGYKQRMRYIIEYAAQHGLIDEEE